MARRRQWGRIRRLPSGRYQARTPDEVPAPLTFTTKADAAHWLAAAEADTLRGTLAPRTTDRLSVAEWLERWHGEHSLHRRPGTLARDRSAIRRHIVPRLGHSSVQITADVYGHIFSETNNAVMARVDEAFGRADSASGSRDGPRDP